MQRCRSGNACSEAKMGMGIAAVGAGHKNPGCALQGTRSALSASADGASAAGAAQCAGSWTTASSAPLERR